MPGQIGKARTSTMTEFKGDHSNATMSEINQVLRRYLRSLLVINTDEWRLLVSRSIDQDGWKAAL